MSDGLYALCLTIRRALRVSVSSDSGPDVSAEQLSGENDLMLARITRRKTALSGALVLTFAMVGTAGATTATMLALGVVNTKHATTTLTGSVTGPEMKIVNNGTGPALALGVDSNRPALSVSSTAKVPKLNADRVDNLDGSQLQRRVGGTCASGSAIRSISATGTVVCEADDINGGNAATLGGVAPSGFYAAGAKVKDSADADHADLADNASALGGLPSSAFMRATIDHNVAGPYSNQAGSQNVGSVSCDEGFVAIGGGVATSPTASTGWDGFEPSMQSITSSLPGQRGRGWTATVTNHGDTAKTFHVFVICVPGTEATLSDAPETAP